MIDEGERNLDPTINMGVPMYSMNDQLSMDGSKKDLGLETELTDYSQFAKKTPEKNMSQNQNLFTKFNKAQNIGEFQQDTKTSSQYGKGNVL